MPPEDPSQLKPAIPDYTLLRLIGRGSYGDVWLARGATGILRAVKVVWRDRFTDIEPYEREFRGLSDFVQHTQGETRQLALLHVGRNEEAGFFYYVMEPADDVVTGRDIDPDCYAPLTLRALRNQSDYVPAPEVLRYAIQLADGLAELHRTGLVHRDIKPSNIIMVDGRPKLADIGLVSIETEAKTFVGTEGFVPPEGPGTRAADVFSLGKVLYELVSGLDRQDYPSLPSNLAERPDRTELLELNETIVKACASRVDERYPDAESLLHELQLLEAGKSVRRLRFAEKGLSRARKWIGVAVAVAIVAAIGAAFERNRANVEAAARAAAEAELADLTRRTLYDASLAAGQRALQTGNFGVARESLERAIPQPGDPDLRGFEWHALYREAQGDPAEIIRTTGEPTTRIETSPDGRWAAVDNFQPNVDLYDQQTGEFIRTLTGIHRIAGFSPDGSRIIGSDPNYALETWSLETGEPDPIPAKPGVNRPLFVDPSAPRLLYFEDGTQNEPHRLAIWNYQTGMDEVSWEIPNREGDQRWLFQAAAATDDLTRVILATIRDAGVLYQQYWRVIDMRTGEITHPGLNSDRAAPVAISPRGDQLLYHTGILQSGTPAITAEQFEPLPINSTSRMIRFNRAGNRFIIASYANEIIEWDLPLGRQATALAGSGSQIDGLAYSADEKYVWSSDRRGEIRRWPIAVPAQKRTQARFDIGPNSSMFSILIDESSSFLATLSRPWKFAIWDLDSLTPLWEQSNIRSVVDSGPESTYVITAEERLIEVETKTGSEISELRPFGPGENIRAVRVSPSGQLWLISSRSGRFVLWDATRRKVLHENHQRDLGLEFDEILKTQLSDDALVLSTGTQQQLTLWNARTGTVEKRVQLQYRPASLNLSHDGKFVTVSGGSEASQVLTFPELELQHEIGDGRRSGTSFAFHPREPILATQVERGSVVLIDYQQGKRSMPLELPLNQGGLPETQVAHITFSPDGNTLVAVDSQGAIRAWHRD